MNAPEWVVTQFAAARLGAVLVNVNPAYRLFELEDALRLADVTTLVVGSAFKSSDFVGMVHSVCPEVAAASDREWSSERLPSLKRLIALGDQPGPGWLSWNDLEAGPACPLEDLDCRQRATGCKRRRQRAVHLRHDRAAQGGDAHPRQFADERLLRGPAPAVHGGGPGLCSGPVLPLLRLCAGQHGLRRVRRDDRRPRAGFRPGCHTRGDGGRAMHLGLRRAHDVRGDARASRLPAVATSPACGPASCRGHPVRCR